MQDEEVDRLGERLLERFPIVGSTHSEVGVVVQHATKQSLSVGGVGLSVEDVGMPEVVDRT